MPENRTIHAKPWGRGHHVSIIATTVAFALSRGMTMAEIERATGLDGEALGDPNARLPDDLAHHLWNALAVAVGYDRALTLEAARSAPFSALGGLAHGVQYAATFRDAIDFLIRNRGLLADRLDIELTETQDEAWLMARHPNDVIDEGRVSEVGAALCARLVREVIGVLTPPLRVELAFPPFGPDAAYRAFFRCPVRFEGSGLALVYPRAALSRPVRGADPTLFGFVERYFEMELGRIARSREPPALSRLRKAIAEAASAGDYRAAGVAAHARMSLRSAQRLASDHGLTLQGMIKEARRSNAEAFLADRSISTATVATLLGFSDERAFRRAFKTWTGETPSAYRKAYRPRPLG